VRKLSYIKTTTNDKLIATIDTYFKAAKYIAQFGADNRVEIFIDDFLARNKDYKTMKQMMPSKTTKALFDYQKNYPYYDNIQLNNDINLINTVLAEGQFLFHGGKWFDDTKTKMNTIKPFSTTFSPLVALNEILHKGKAYDANGIDLFVMKVKNPKTSVFVYKNKGTRLGHEKEVLFSSGAILELKSVQIIKTNFKVSKALKDSRIIEKDVVIRILEVDIQ